METIRSRIYATFGAFERTICIGGAVALGWWLWPGGFLSGPVAALTLKSVLLAAMSMGVLAVASLMLLFAVAEPIAALLQSVRKSGYMQRRLPPS